MQFIIITLALGAIGIGANQPGFPEGRIINGQEAAKGEAPYIVSFKKISHFCAGSIIDEHWVVTAAHCLIYNSFEIVAGLHERSNEYDAQVRHVPNTTFQFAHEKYGGSVGPYDIALVYVAEPFYFNALERNGSAPVGKIHLPSGKYTQTGKGKLYGWGRNNIGILPNALQTLNATIISYAQCKKDLPISAPLDVLNICSYTAGTTDGACNGDSGGPLIRHTSAGPEIVGIVSWGYTPCAITSYPSVYTRTAAFKNWIQTITDNFYAVSNKFNN